MKENVKYLTKEDVISLSNMEKRQRFIEDYQSWGVWLDIPQLGVRVYKAVLPEGQSVIVTEFITKYGKIGIYRYVGSDGYYSPYSDSISVIAYSLKDLKVKYCAERRKEKLKEGDEV
ncbi:hypothetical protein [Ructibacterium gallinarum]|uniref:Uncharacterized protein n=1 Tax=Ructibacterium gallinarum TaxID=2779355 RepID=A0A9D5M4N5_9FIRM|nr:hypothetical protein [Ructibacterium gallinarum]MBE5040535.1 hypothetical protein [Ructibacterium gallinarum]